MGLHVTWHLLRHGYATMLDVWYAGGTMQSCSVIRAGNHARIYLHAFLKNKGEQWKVSSGWYLDSIGLKLRRLKAPRRRESIES